MFIATMYEDGKKHFARAFSTEAEALTEARRLWMGGKFNIAKLNPKELEGVYDVSHYINPTK